MVHGKRPTRRQKEIIATARLNPGNWLVTKNLLDYLYLKHRVSGNEKVLKVRRSNTGQASLS